jgi:NAD(P)-dependent dehydrogenase (short-subunit alcohol dehydrogenase family)
VALVTGGAGGIGRASATALAASGARVVVADAGGGAALQVAAGIGPASAVGVEFDVADSAAADAAIAGVAARWGRLDLLVHCAAVVLEKPVVDHTDEDWRHVLAVNLDGTFYVARAAARQMQRQRSGAIVLLASDRGLLGAPRRASYAASKGGVIALMRSLAAELGPAGVTVNAINPGTTNTPMARAGLSDEQWSALASRDPLGRLSEPEEIARTVLFLAASPNLTGQLLTTRVRSG